MVAFSIASNATSITYTQWTDVQSKLAYHFFHFTCKVIAIMVINSIDEIAVTLPAK
jgi:hypothetical protein